MGSVFSTLGETAMGNYKDHRELRRRRRHHDPGSPSEQRPEPSYFLRSHAADATTLDAEVLWFDISRGFGFVKLSDGTEAYLHATVLEAAGIPSVPEGMLLKVVTDETARGRQVTLVLDSKRESAKPSAHAHVADAFRSAQDAPEQIAGTIKWYNSEKGFGFISPDNGEKDIFVHATALSRACITELSVGQNVVVECAKGKKGLEARNIRLA